MRCLTGRYSEAVPGAQQAGSITLQLTRTTGLGLSDGAKEMDGPSDEAKEVDRLLDGAKETDALLDGAKATDGAKAMDRAEETEAMGGFADCIEGRLLLSGRG